MSLPLVDEQAFPQIQYRTGSSGQANASIKGTGIRVQTIVISSTDWAWEISKIAQEYDLSLAQVSEALRFYEVHKEQMDGAIRAEVNLEAIHV